MATKHEQSAASHRDRHDDDHEGPGPPKPVAGPSGKGETHRPYCAHTPTSVSGHPNCRCDDHRAKLEHVLLVVERSAMYVGLSKEHEALRDELRAYYDELLTPEVEDDLRKG